VALPDRAWIGRTIGRVVVGGTGVLLLGFGVLQAWPGRGFWQGSIGHGPGTLAGMVAQMAQTSQPGPLSSLVSSFASFDRAHGWGVNLVAVLVMLAIGTVLVGVGLAAGDKDAGADPAADGVTVRDPVGGTLGRLLVPALVVLAVACLADWVLIEDFGFWAAWGRTRIPCCRSSS
jgi:hypothetical protein